MGKENYGKVTIDGQVYDLDAFGDQSGYLSSATGSDIDYFADDPFGFSEVEVKAPSNYFSDDNNENLSLHRRFSIDGNDLAEIPANGDGNCLFNGFTLGLIDIINRQGDLPMSADNFAIFWGYVSSAANLEMLEQRASYYLGTHFAELAPPILTFVDFVANNPDCSMVDFCNYVKQQNTRIALAGFHVCLAPALRELTVAANNSGLAACSLEDGEADAGDVELVVLSEFFNVTPKVVNEERRRHWLLSFAGKPVADIPDYGDANDFLNGFTSGLVNFIQGQGKPLSINEADFSVFWSYVRAPANVASLRQLAQGYAGTHQAKLIEPVLQFVDFIEKTPNCSSKDFCAYIKRQNSLIAQEGFQGCLAPAMRTYIQQNAGVLEGFDANLRTEDLTLIFLGELFNVAPAVETQYRSEFLAFDPVVNNISSGPEYTMSLLHVPGHWNFLIPADPVKYAHWYTALPRHFAQAIHKAADVIVDASRNLFNSFQAQPQNPVTQSQVNIPAAAGGNTSKADPVQPQKSVARTRVKISPISKDMEVKGNTSAMDLGNSPRGAPKPPQVQPQKSVARSRAKTPAGSKDRIDIEAEVNTSVGRILDALEQNAEIPKARRQQIFENVFDTGQKAYKALTAEKNVKKRFDLFEQYRTMVHRELNNVQNFKKPAGKTVKKTCAQSVKHETHTTTRTPIAVM